MPNLRPIEILVIVLVILLLFGARRLPDLARSVGRSLKIFKSEVKDLRDDDDPAPNEGRALPDARSDVGSDHLADHRPDARPNSLRAGTTPPHGDPATVPTDLPTDLPTDSVDRKQV